MATYNGERFLVEQMNSIIVQLGNDDEVIVVDDGSTDSTLDIIASYGDPRIKVFRHDKNQGIVASFGEAILHATGDLLFFSDQDDVWAHDRVQIIVDVFSARPDISIVITDVALIDEKGVSLRSDKRLTRRPFDARFLPNFISNRFQGSAMAIRSGLRDDIFPFPKKVTFLHDAWIGMRSALSGRRSTYIDSPLLYYRRHGRNDSGRLSAWGKLRSRIEMLTELLIFPFRRYKAAGTSRLSTNR
jgi:glycosyltransferase involved in cell wall biosynthesis